MKEWYYAILVLMRLILPKYRLIFKERLKLSLSFILLSAVTMRVHKYVVLLAYSKIYNTHWERKKKKNTPNDVLIMVSHIWNHLSSHSLVFTFASVLNWSDHIIIIHSYATQIISSDLSAATIHHTYTIYYWQAQECPSARFIKGWDIVVLIS